MCLGETATGVDPSGSVVREGREGGRREGEGEGGREGRGGGEGGGRGGSEGREQLSP